MKAVTPIAPGLDLPVTIFAKDQPQYNQLPAYVDSQGAVITRWKLTWRERLRILFSGNLWLIVLTFGRPLQPVKLETACPHFEALPPDDRPEAA
jgi:hypothetical protein